MADLLRKPVRGSGKVHDITPESAGWGYVGFGLYRLAAGDTVAEATGDRRRPRPSQTACCGPDPSAQTTY